MCELEEIELHTNNVYVIEKCDLTIVIKIIIDSNEKSISEDDVKKIIEKLSEFTGASKEIKERHIKDVKKIKENILNQCPRCKRKIVKRVNKSTGEFFIGCAGFPKCRYSTLTYDSP